MHYFRGENLDGDRFRAIRDILLRWSAGDTGALTGATAPLVRNDMREVALTLGRDRLEHLEELVRWMEEHMDPACWGSPETVTAWIHRHESVGNNESARKPK